MTEEIKKDRYEAVIGVEVHIQLATQSKIFCRCHNSSQAAPNSHVCEVCTGQPGALPVLNQAVVTDAVKVALATNCAIRTVSEFSRKHYFYPDLPKNFQITQADFPIAEHGHLVVPQEDGSVKTVRIRRIHIEEDAGKSIHAYDGSSSFVDLNRAGTPLLEIVSEPDMHSPQEVRLYLQELHAIVTALGVCSGNMEEGAFRADSNVSVRLKGAEKLGTRCELKNINSFKFIADAVTYEIERQIACLEQGEQIVQQTRLWDTKQRITIPMRSKEEAADYRYMPEPDLPVLVLEQDEIERVRAEVPELPAARVERMSREYGLTPYEARILAYSVPLSRYFEEAARHTRSAHLANWVLRDLLAHVKEQGIDVVDCLTADHPLRPAQLGALVSLVDAGTINARTAQEVFVQMATSGKEPRVIIAEQGLTQIGSAQELEAILQRIIAEHPQQVAEYRGGKVKLWGFFIGKAMEQTKGRADPALLQELLKRLLK